MNGHKFCGHCGSELNNGSFCGKCGAPVEQPPVEQAPISQAPVEPAPVVAEPYQMPGTIAPEKIEQLKAAQPQPVEPVATKKKFLKKPLIFGAIAVAAVALIAGVAFAIISGLPKSRTVMVYMIGSNLETEGSAGSLDIKEMIDSKFDPEYTKVVVYTGGAKAWALDEISPNENAIFEVSSDGIKKVKTYDKKIMTNGSTLTEYIDYVYENYKTDLYDLVLWNHGGGPIIGYGHDENSLTGKTMTLSELTSALKDTKLISSNKKFDFIGFDACLMGSIEVGVALKDYSNFMIASEESEPGWGWNYAFLSENTGNTKTEELGEAVVRNFLKHYDDYPYKVQLSLSVMNLAKLDKVASSADKLFDTVKEEINTSNFSEYSRIMTRSMIYGYNGRDSDSYDLVDLQDLASALESKHPNEVSDLKNAISEAVVYSDTNMKSTNGISIYFPTTNKANLEKLLSRYESVSYSSDYYKFLTKYANFITGTKIVTRSTYDKLPETTEGETVSVELPSELVDNYQKAEVIIFRKLGDNKFMPIYRGSDVELNGKTLKTKSTNLQFVVATVDGKTGEKDYGWIALYEKARTEDYADYTSFGVLYYNDNSLLGFSPKSYEMHLRLNKGEKVAEVRDIRVQADEDGLSGKISFAPEKIKIIEMTVGAYKLFDKKGNYLDNLESYGTLYGTSLNLEAGDKYEIRLENLNFDFGNMYEGEFDNALDDYYAEFVVYDTQGDAHRLNLIHINK
jgi:hypothetical protein